MNSLRRLRRARLRAITRTVTQVSGCTCRPEVVLHGSAHAVVHHDAWCPMVETPRSQVVIYATETEKGCARD